MSEEEINDFSDLDAFDRQLYICGIRTHSNPPDHGTFASVIERFYAADDQPQTTDQIIVKFDGRNILEDPEFQKIYNREYLEEQRRITIDLVLNNERIKEYLSTHLYQEIHYIDMREDAFYVTYRDRCRPILFPQFLNDAIRDSLAQAPIDPSILGPGG